MLPDIVVTLNHHKNWRLQYLKYKNATRLYEAFQTCVVEAVPRDVTDVWWTFASNVFGQKPVIGIDSIAKFLKLTKADLDNHLKTPESRANFLMQLLTDDRVVKMIQKNSAADPNAYTVEKCEVLLSQKFFALTLRQIQSNTTLTGGEPEDFVPGQGYPIDKRDRSMFDVLMKSKKPVIFDCGRMHGLGLLDMLNEQNKYTFHVIDSKTDDFEYPPNSEFEQLKIDRLEELMKKNTKNFHSKIVKEPYNSFGTTTSEFAITHWS